MTLQVLLYFSQLLLLCQAMSARSILLSYSKSFVGPRPRSREILGVCLFTKTQLNSGTIKCMFVLIFLDVDKGNDT